MESGLGGGEVSGGGGCCEQGGRGLVLDGHHRIPIAVAAAAAPGKPAFDPLQDQRVGFAS